ncbi:MAG: cyclase family protein [Saprospiraceae bacterium]|nr:cyclase family protein [Saprospiraceae bacterium]
MGQLIDISNPLHPDLPVWPGSHGIHIHRILDQEKGDAATVSRLDIDIHSGTHIDAPLHFVKNGATTEEIPLDKLNGPCRVADLRGIPIITHRHLEALRLPSNTRKLLLKTDNSEKWTDLRHTFDKDYAAISQEAAQWVVDQGIELIGIDYHSIQRFSDPIDTHVTLLKNKVVILEGLNLKSIQSGPYRLWCLPVRILGVEGAPARAVLETV